MRIFRITKTQYIDDLSGEGARLYGGRWNKVGDAMLYFSQNLSLSLLEIIVHANYSELSKDYSYLEAEIPDSNMKTIKSIDFIRPYWRTEAAVNQLQMLGSNWLSKMDALSMKVPSAILPQESNILINPGHKDFKNIKIIDIKKLDVDPRLFR